MSPAGLNIASLDVSGPDGAILSDVSLSLPTVGLVGLIGPVGSGKSTLLKVLAGEAEREGLDVHCASPCNAHKRVALFAQRPREAAADPQISRAMADERIAQIKALVREPADALCVDEPTAGLLEPEARRIVSCLMDIATTRLVIMVTHQLHLITNDWSRIVLIGWGRVLADTDAETFLSDTAGAYAEHFRRTRGLVMPSLKAGGRTVDDRFRGLPAGVIDGLLPACPCGWIIPDRFWIARGPDVGCDWDAQSCFELSAGDVRRRLGRGEWVSAGGIGDTDILRTAKDIADELATGRTVLLHARENREATLKLLGAVFVSMGVSADDASNALNRCMDAPNLRLEQFLWDLDLRFALEAR